MLLATPHQSIQQIRQAVGVGVIFHRLADIVEQRACFGIESSQLFFESARHQILVHLSISQLTFFEILLHRKWGQATYPEFSGAGRVGEASCPGWAHRGRCLT